jgi:hypothetical protein
LQFSRQRVDADAPPIWRKMKLFSFSVQDRRIKKNITLHMPDDKPNNSKSRASPVIAGASALALLRPSCPWGSPIRLNM